MATKKRAINDTFLEALKTGEHKQIVDIVRGDDDLNLQLRGDCADVYYRSCEILKIDPSKENPYSISKSYNCPIAPGSNTSWKEYFMWAKQSIDDYNKGNDENFEGNIQQRLIQENNFFQSANGSDYFVIDSEYTIPKEDGRFDIVAAHWPENNRISGKAELAVIEIKAGEKAINNSAGIKKHFEDAKAYFKDRDGINEFCSDMEQVFAQLRELGLVRFGVNGNLHPVKFSRTDFQFIFVFADYHQASTQLPTALKEIDDKYLPFKLLFATASFMGYGLYDEGMLCLEKFKEHL
jgi:tRNA-binding EMAP/Myf-like protein